jgi:hypothetical protein
MLFFNSGSTGCGSAFTCSLNGQVSIKTQISDTVERRLLADRASIEGKATSTDCHVRSSYTRTFVMPLPSLRWCFTTGCSVMSPNRTVCCPLKKLNGCCCRQTRRTAWVVQMWCVLKTKQWERQAYVNKTTFVTRCQPGSSIWRESQHNVTFYDIKLSCLFI